MIIFIRYRLMSRVLRDDVKPVLCVLTAPLKRERLQICHRQKSVPSHVSTLHARPQVFRSFTTFRAKTIARLYGSTAIGYKSPGNGSDDAQKAAEAPTPPLAIVFTDIVKSTAMWEKDCASMSEAMDIHDRLARDLALKYAGYEVKQNGDGFMFVFQSAISALDFCLDMQLQLQTQEWPQDLLGLGPAEPIIDTQSRHHAEQAKDGEVVLWKGLRLRMSAHYGEPVCKWNEVIGRMDYLGPAVNRAARSIGVCEGGQIVVSEEFLDKLWSARHDMVGSGGPLFDETKKTTAIGRDLDLKEMRYGEVLEEIEDTKFEVRALGKRHFKGVSEKQRLFFILPKSLRGRLRFLSWHKYVQASKGNLIEDG